MRTEIPDYLIVKEIFSKFADKRYSILIFLAKISLAVVLLLILYHLGLLRLEPLTAFAERPSLLIFLIFLSWLTFPLCALRWHILLEIQSVHAKLTEVFKVQYVSTFFGLFLPGVIGGDVVRIILGNRFSHKHMATIGFTVLFDRLIGVLGLFILGFIVLVWFNQTAQSSTFQTVLFTLAVLIFLIIIAIALTWIFSLFLSNICEKDNWESKGVFRRLIAKFVKVMSLYRKNPRKLVLCLCLSLITHFKDVLILLMIAAVMGLNDTDMLVYAAAGILTFLVNFLPITPGGLGIGEATFGQTVNMLAPAAVPLATSTVPLAHRAIIGFSLLPAPFLYWMMLRAKKYS